MTGIQHIRLMDPTRSGHVLAQFPTVERDWRKVLAEAFALLHPSWAQLSHMQMMLEVYEDGIWQPYL